jgi:hypothetical protein
MSRFSIRALAYATHAAIWFVALVTVAAERSSSVKGLLEGLTGHHWTAKGVISMAIFFAVAFLFAKKEDPQDLSKLIRGVLISVVLGAMTIFGFYVLHYYGFA